MPDGKGGIRIVKFGFVRHRLSLLAQQVPVVQAGVRIVKFGIVRHLFSLLAQQVPVVQAGVRQYCL